MVAAPPQALFEEVTDFLAAGPTPEQIITFKPSEELDERLHRLLDKKTIESLTVEEQTELDEFLRLSHFMNMLVLKARLKLTEKK